MEYKVIINDKETIVNVTKNDSNDTNMVYKDVLQACFNVAQKEYDYGIERSNKLDTKIYYLLCIAVFLGGILLELINKFKFSKCQPIVMEKVVLNIVNVLCPAIAIFLFAWLLFELIKLLRGVNAPRVDLKDMLTKDLLSYKHYEAYEYFCKIYAECVAIHTEATNKRYVAFNRAIKILIADIGVIFVDVIVKKFC